MAISAFGKVGVLMGGFSTEREISLKSGQAVYAALKQQGIEAVSIDIQTDSRQENIRLIQSLNINCAFLALHGRFGEDGQIQQLLEDLNIPYTGPGVEASRLAMDKLASRRIFAAHGLSVPRYISLNQASYRKDLSIADAFALPWVVKPASHGSSVGLSMIEQKDRLYPAIDLAFSFDEVILIEEYIKGRELTVGILDDKPLAVIEIIPKNNLFDYQAKYQAGMTEYIVPAELPFEITHRVQEAALLSYKLLGCQGCSRVDMILRGDNTVFILEVNSIPGLTDNSLLPKAAKVNGIEFGQLCLKLIELAYEKAKDKISPPPGNKTCLRN